jgi:hypothetical protein
MVIVGLAVATWLIDRTIIHPWSEITGDLAFWIPFLATILAGSGLLAALFFKAARRLQPPSNDSSNSHPGRH